MKHPDPSMLSIDSSVRTRLLHHIGLLEQWNPRINLVSTRDIATLWERHVLDSLQLLPLIDAPLDCHGIDLGSGAGFPGMVLAIASGRTFHLVESDRRKAAFLREAARATSAPVIIHNARIEALTLPPASVLTARGLASLDVLLAWASPHLSETAVCLFPKGRNVEQELTMAARQWHMRVERVASRTDPTGTILRISEVRRVGPQHTL